MTNMRYALLQPLLGLQRKTSLFNATVLLITQFPAENFVKTTSLHNKAFCVSVCLWIFVWMAHCGTEPDSSFFITMRCLMRRHHLIHTLLLSTAPETSIRNTSGANKDNKPRNLSWFYWGCQRDHIILVVLPRWYGKEKGTAQRCLQKDDNHINPGRQSPQQTIGAQAAIQYIPTHAWRGTLRRNIFVGPLQRVRPRNGILGLVVVLVVLVVLVPLRSEFIGEL